MAAQPVSVPVVPEASTNSDIDLEPKHSSKLASSQISLDSATVQENYQANPFLDPKIAAHYKQIYEDAKYECRHVYDPDLRWTNAEEKHIIRRVDWHVATWACIMFFALNLDRGNLKQAVSDNLLDDLNLTTNDYNTGNTIFYVSFLLAELPSQLISKRVGPDRWIPTQMVLWSVVAAAQAGLRGRATFFACRSLLGILEGGFIPDLVLWLSYFYKSSELSLRLSFFWIASDLTVVISSFMAYGLLHLRGVSGLEGWRWLFLVEGLITCVIGLASFFLMPASAVQTKTWFRPNGWWNDHDLGIVVNRVLRDDPSKGDMNNRTGINLKALWAAVTDYDLWPIYLIGVLVYIPQNPPGQYLTLSLRSLGFNPFNTNLLSIPCELISCFTLFAITWTAERTGQRCFVAMFQNIWILPCIIALRWWPGAQVNAWGTYGLISTLLSYPYCHAIIVALASRNSGSVRTRSVSAAAYNMLVQLGNIISSNIYRQDDKPLYHRGNSVLFALDVLAIALFLSTKAYYVWKNNIRSKKWDAMSEEQRVEYLDTTTHEGNKRLDFRFAH